MTDATDRGRSVRGDALARIACVGCGLSLTAPAEAFDGRGARCRAEATA